jgi:hypothetical protein
MFGFLFLLPAGQPASLWKDRQKLHGFKNTEQTASQSYQAVNFEYIAVQWPVGNPVLSKRDSQLPLYSTF